MLKFPYFGLNHKVIALTRENVEGDGVFNAKLCTFEDLLLQKHLSTLGSEDDWNAQGYLQGK